MGCLFATRRDPADPHQLRIAIHELGHAAVWSDAGLTVREVVHEGDSGYCDVVWDRTKLPGYAIGCWGGFEAEDRWLRARGAGHASRGNASHDIKNFRHVAGNEPSMPERRARTLARAAVDRHWRRIETLAPQLITAGRLTRVRF